MVFKRKARKKVEFDENDYEMDDEEEEVTTEDDDEQEEEYEEQVKKAVSVPKKVPKIAPKERWVVKEVPTQTQPVISDEKNGKMYDLYSALALILNRTE